MSNHTFVCSSGRRLNIRPSKTSPGLVEISILSADRELVASCTMCASSADVASKAMAMEALAAEARIVGAKVEVRAFGCDCGGFCEGWENDGCVSRKAIAKPIVMGGHVVAGDESEVRLGALFGVADSAVRL